MLTYSNDKALHSKATVQNGSINREQIWDFLKRVHYAKEAKQRRRIKRHIQTSDVIREVDYSFATKLSHMTKVR